MQTKSDIYDFRERFQNQDERNQLKMFPPCEDSHRICGLKLLVVDVFIGLL